MGDELLLKLDRVSSGGSPGYEDFDLSSVLTEAERLYVKKFIDKKNNRKGESFDETEIRNQGLSALIKRGAGLTVSASQTDVIANGQFFDLPSDFMYCIHEDATIDKIQCDTESTNISAEVIPVGYDEVSRLKNNKYKKPYYLSHGDARIWRLVYSRTDDGHNPAVVATTKRHQLVTDATFSVSTYSINYLQNPKGIIVDKTTVANQRNCILDESTHRTIIDMAVSLMLERVKEQELQNIESFKDTE
jgi:hypothetical protein